MGHREEPASSLHLGSAQAAQQAELPAASGCIWDAGARQLPAAGQGLRASAATQCSDAGESPFASDHVISSSSPDPIAWSSQKKVRQASFGVRLMVVCSAVCHRMQRLLVANDMGQG